MELSQQTKLFVIFAIILISLLGISDFLFLRQKLQPSLTPSTQPLPPTTSQLSTLPDTTANWKTYRNEKYGFEFRYPEEWGELKIELPENEPDFSFKETLTQQIENGVFSFIPEDSKIVKIWYHPKSETLAFLKKGKEITTIDKTSGYQGQLYAGKDLNFSLIFEIPEQVAKWHSTISYLSFSPDGKYIAFNLSEWESSSSYIINLQTKKDILEVFVVDKERPWLREVYVENLFEDIIWSPDSKNLAVISTFPEIGGYGMEAVIVSDFQNPDKLNVVYSLFDEFEKVDFFESGIFNPQFSDDGKTLRFQIKVKEWEKEEVIQKAFEYNLITKELKEI